MFIYIHYIEASWVLSITLKNKESFSVAFSKMKNFFLKVKHSFERGPNFTQIWHSAAKVPYFGISSMAYKIMLALMRVLDILTKRSISYYTLLDK